MRNTAEVIKYIISVEGKIVEANAEITLLKSKVKALQSIIDQYRRGELDPG